MGDLKKLAKLLKDRNNTEKEINHLTKYPVSTGQLGEYIAEIIFNVGEAESRIETGNDGTFKNGTFRKNNLTDKTVNIKWYTSTYNYLVMDRDKDKRPDYFLVLRGGTKRATSTKNMFYPLHVSSVHLFPTEELIKQLSGKVGIGTSQSRATSVKKEYWDEYKIYSEEDDNYENPVTEKGAYLLGMFSSESLS